MSKCSAIQLKAWLKARRSLGGAGLLFTIMSKENGLTKWCCRGDEEVAFVKPILHSNTAVKSTNATGILIPSITLTPT